MSAHLARFTGTLDTLTRVTTYTLGFWCGVPPEPNDFVTTKLADVDCSSCILAVHRPDESQRDPRRSQERLSSEP